MLNKYVQLLLHNQGRFLLWDTSFCRQGEQAMERLSNLSHSHQMAEVGFESGPLV